MMVSLPRVTGSARSAAMFLAVSLLCLGQSCPSPSPVPGDDAQRVVYGDGSAGDLNVEADSTLSEVAPDGNWQFRNVTIAANVVFEVPSGTTLLCTGTLTNRGTILVHTGVVAPETSQIAPQGVSLSGAEPGEIQDETVIAGGGRGGLGLAGNRALSLLSAPIAAGGAGGTTLYQQGAAGGGGFRVLAQAGIVNEGTIRADGDTTVQSGAGGGAGGVIILASSERITNTGAIYAQGGYGGPTADSFGGGGGGSGGIVRLVSPSITAGTIDVTGGGGGTPQAGATQPMHYGGAGGGACGGNGGYGGSVLYAPDNIAYGGQNGRPGQVISTVADPASMWW